MRPAHADPRHRFRRSPSLSYPLSLCCAVSPFEALVHALDCADIEGEDSAISPLTQATLDRLVADPDAFRKMSAFLQHKFTIRGSGQPLSEKQATNLAIGAVMCLSSGAFLLHPYTLVGRVQCVIFPSHRRMRMVCPGPRSLLPVADVHAGSLRDKAGTAAWLLHVVGATALAHPTGVVLLWPSARMFCDAPCGCPRHACPSWCFQPRYSNTCLCVAVW